MVNATIAFIWLLDLSQWTQHVEVEFPAYNCSYTTMENDTKVIIHVATIDKQQTSWNSVIMEKEGFIQTVDKLTSQIKLVEICTDAHAQIGALMNKYSSDIMYEYMWWKDYWNIVVKLHCSTLHRPRQKQIQGPQNSSQSGHVAWCQEPGQKKLL